MRARFRPCAVYDLYLPLNALEEFVPASVRLRRADGGVTFKGDGLHATEYARFQRQARNAVRVLQAGASVGMVITILGADPTVLGLRVFSTRPEAQRFFERNQPGAR